MSITICKSCNKHWEVTSRGRPPFLCPECAQVQAQIRQIKSDADSATRHRTPAPIKSSASVAYLDEDPSWVTAMRDLLREESA